jgi:hypothetical protein
MINYLHTFLLFLSFASILSAQTITVQGDVTNLRLSDCSDCSSSADPRIKARISTQLKPWSGEYRNERDNVGCNGSLSANAGTYTATAVTTTETWWVDIRGFESDGFICGGDDGVCDSYSSPTGQSGSIIATWAPSCGGAYSTFTANRTCTAGGTQTYTCDTRLRWVWEAPSLTNANAGGTLSYNGNTSACPGYDPPVLTGTSLLSDRFNSRQWELSFNGSAFNDVAGATGRDFDPASITTPGTYVYRRRLGYCTSFTGAVTSVYSNSITIVINSNSSAASSISGTNTICSGNNTTLSVSGGSLGSAANWQWFSGSCGGTLVGTGTSISLNPGSSTTYFVRASGTCNTTSCVSRSITVNSLSQAPVGISEISGTNSICEGLSTTLNVTGGSLGTAANWEWFSGGCAGTAIGTGNSINISPTANTTYYVRASGTCNTTICANQAITLNTLSSAPVINAVNGKQCPNTDITLNASGGTVGTGSNIRWYSSPNGTGFLGTGNSIIVAPNSNNTYYARREGICNNTNDASVAVQVRNVIYTAAGTTSSNTYCTDNNGWKHFYTLGDEDIIFSLQGDLSGANISPTVSIENNATFHQNNLGPSTAPNCAIGQNPGEERFEMQRNWNVNFQGTLLPPYTVRYYFPASEKVDIETASANWISNYPACSYTYKYNTNPSGFFWFKNSFGNYTSPDFDGLQLSAVSGNTNGINYSEMSGINSFSGGSGAVILVPVSNLPVELTYFRGENQGKSNLLYWETASEQNNAYFILERSSDAQQFTALGQIEGNGNSNQNQFYSFTDINPTTGINYYRLKQVDSDGSFSYSQVIALEVKASDSQVNIYPNPSSDIISIEFVNDTNSEIHIKIYDVLGHLVRNVNLGSTKGHQVYNLSLSNLPEGAYLIQLSDDSEKIITKQTLIKTAK